jgi:cytoplasmic iron level regulating protein YaaA (DUF328/UPF0246 family)
MLTLFSPSEGKKPGGSQPPLSQDSFIFPDLFGVRLDAVKRYNNFVATASDPELSRLFGIKDPRQFAPYKADLCRQSTMKAIERYDGVAFDYLDYNSLGTKEQHYIDHHTLIFSNLFGPILAGDIGLPEYKLKQGAKLDGLALERYYKEHFSPKLDELLSAQPFLDLRAGYYHKFYKPSSPYTTLKFIKNGKVVSHWAKAYRGIVLRHLALHQIQSMDAFMQLPIKDLATKEIIRKGIHTEIVFDICDHLGP